MGFLSARSLPFPFCQLVAERQQSATVQRRFSDVHTSRLRCWIGPRSHRMKWKHHKHFLDSSQSTKTTKCRNKHLAETHWELAAGWAVINLSPRIWVNCRQRGRSRTMVQTLYKTKRHEACQWLNDKRSGNFRGRWEWVTAPPAGCCVTGGPNRANPMERGLSESGEPHGNTCVRRVKAEKIEEIMEYPSACLLFRHICFIAGKMESLTGS